MENNEIKYNIIYVYTINDFAHSNLLKIGKASFCFSQSPSAFPNDCDFLRKIAIKRIKQQTQTAIVNFDLLFVTLGRRLVILPDGFSSLESFSDSDIHSLLKEKGIFPRKINGKESEWFSVSLPLVKEIIENYKDYYKEKNNNYNNTISFINSPYYVDLENRYI
jgi:hypothetical protein